MTVTDKQIDALIGAIKTLTLVVGLIGAGLGMSMCSISSNLANNASSTRGIDSRLSSISSHLNVIDQAANDINRRGVRVRVGAEGIWVRGCR